MCIRDRSNPESAQSALCSAIVGLTPRYGLLLEENRRASVYVNVEREIADEFDFSLLGWAAAKKIGRDVPLFRDVYKRQSTSSALSEKEPTSISPFCILAVESHS